MFYLGIDVAKSKLDCALLLQPDKSRSKVVANERAGYETLCTWLRRQGVSQLSEVHVILEATGPYHEQAALWLVQAGARVSVVNPAQVKDFARGLALRTKTDAIDALTLARYGALAAPAPWQPPAPEIVELKALLTRLEALQADLRRELNRREKALAAAAPALIRESLDKSIGFLEAERARLERAIDDHIDRHPRLKTDRQHLLSIPAVGEKTANRMLALLHSRRFSSAEQLAAFLGLVPVEHQSGSSVQRRARLSKNGDARLRAALYMAAVVATRYNPDVRALYQRLCARGKAKMAALGAAMRKLVHICFGVIKHQQPYRPNLVPQQG